MSQGVFCHYMVGGMTPDQAVTDVTQAKAMGCDAFALNIISLDWWSTASVQYLFDAAAAAGFKLFFSFDMLHFSSPSQFFPLLLLWYTHAAYYLHNGLPFVSTFSGGSLTFGAPTPTLGWQAQYHDALGALGIKTYFVPTFLDTSVAPSDFFNAYPSVDGQFNWNSWSWISEGKVQVSDVADQQYHDAAIAAGKTFMMGISPLQFKHLDGGNNWYRRGELTLAERVPQILSLQPDFVQIQTWNDGGESSYIGNVWDNAIVGSPAHGYIDGFDHSGWQILMKAFIAAYKSGGRTAADVVPVSGNGKNAEGVFWYHPILSTASCSADPLGRPAGAENAEDAVQVAVMLAGPAVGATVNVYSGGALIGSYKGVKGLNSWSVDGLNVGEQKVEVIGTDGSVLLSAVGQQAVQPDATVCNFNHAVVGLR